MKFYFKDKTNKFKPSDFEPIARYVFKKLEIADKIELGLKITDNQEIKKLNQKYRGVNQATDVLSFPIDLPDKKTKKNLMLGDIVISQQFALKHHERMTELFKHGLLHLLGYDHEKNNKEWQKIVKLLNY